MFRIQPNHFFDTFLCLAHEEAPVTTVTRRTDLYGRVVRGLARRAWKEKPLARTDPHVDDLVQFLVRIGRPLFQRHTAGNIFTHSEITRALEESSKLPVPLSALEARSAGQPMARVGHSYRYCVKGGGSVRATFDRRGMADRISYRVGRRLKTQTLRGARTGRSASVRSLPR